MDKIRVGEAEVWCPGDWDSPARTSKLHTCLLGRQRFLLLDHTGKSVLGGYVPEAVDAVFVDGGDWTGLLLMDAGHAPLRYVIVQELVTEYAVSGANCFPTLSLGVLVHLVDECVLKVAECAPGGLKELWGFNIDEVKLPWLPIRNPLVKQERRNLVTAVSLQSSSRSQVVFRIRFGKVHAWCLRLMAGVNETLVLHTELSDELWPRSKDVRLEGGKLTFLDDSGCGGYPITSSVLTVRVPNQTPIGSTVDTWSVRALETDEVRVYHQDVWMCSIPWEQDLSWGAYDQFVLIRGVTNATYVHTSRLQGVGGFGRLPMPREFFKEAARHGTSLLMTEVKGDLLRVFELTGEPTEMRSNLVYERRQPGVTDYCILSPHFVTTLWKDKTVRIYRMDTELLRFTVRDGYEKLQTCPEGVLFVGDGCEVTAARPVLLRACFQS